MVEIEARLVEEHLEDAGLVADLHPAAGEDQGSAMGAGAGGRGPVFARVGHQRPSSIRIAALRSASAAIVRDGFAPSASGTIEPSAT